MTQHNIKMRKLNQFIPKTSQKVFNIKDLELKN